MRRSNAAAGSLDARHQRSLHQHLDVHIIVAAADRDGRDLDARISATADATRTWHVQLELDGVRRTEGPVIVDSFSPWIARSKRTPSIDPADFVSVRILVQALLAMVASQVEAGGGPSPQEWLNHISACCQEAVVASTLTDGIDGDTFRTRIVEQMNHLLAGVRFPEPAPLDS